MLNSVRASENNFKVKATIKPVGTRFKFSCDYFHLGTRNRPQK